MIDATPVTLQRFGRTSVLPVIGDLLAQPVDVLVCAANRRGLMGAGHAGAIRLAGGAGIEREAMALAPLTLGTAIRSAPGRLVDRGVVAIVHAVVNDGLAAPTRLDTVRRAIQALLQIADAQRFRSIAIPLLGSGTGPDRLSTAVAATALVDEVVGHLRRSPGRIERLLLVGREEEEERLLAALLAESRDFSWPVPRS